MTTTGTPSAQRMIDFMTRSPRFALERHVDLTGSPPSTRSSGRGQRPVEIVVDRRRELLHVRGEEMIGAGDRFVLDLHALLVSQLFRELFRGLSRHDVIALAVQDQS